MSELYPNMAAFGAGYSKWGYEMTMKVRESYAETGTWALDLLAHLARYTFQTGNFFEPGAYIPGDGSSLHPELGSAITGLAIVGDTTVAVSLINGLGNDDNLFKVFPKERCIIGSSVLGTALP